SRASDGFRPRARTRRNASTAPSSRSWATLRIPTALSHCTEVRPRFGSCWRSSVRWVTAGDGFFFMRAPLLAAPVSQASAVLHRHEDFRRAQLDREIAAGDLCVRQAGAFQAGRAQVQATQIGIAEIGVAEVDAGGIHAAQVEAAKVTLAQVQAAVLLALAVEDRKSVV